MMVQMPNILAPNPVTGPPGPFRGPSGKPKAIVVDLDRTIADVSIRDLKASRYKYLSDEWYKAFCDIDYIKEDKPFKEAAFRLWEYVALGHTIIYLTGRHKEGEVNSITWLRDHGFPLYPVVYQFKNSREFSEHHTAEYKKKKLQVFMQRYDIVALFDDNEEVIRAVDTMVRTFHVTDPNFWVNHYPPLPDNLEDLNALSEHLEREHLNSAHENDDRTHHIRMGVAVTRVQELIRNKTLQVGADMKEESWPRENPGGIISAAVGGILVHFGAQAVSKAIELLVSTSTPRENPEKCVRKLLEPDDINLFNMSSEGWALDWNRMFAGKALWNYFFVYRCGSGQPIDALMVLKPREEHKSLEVYAIEAAPWNRAENGPPKIRGLGRMMIYDAITASLKMGFKGALMLWSLQDAMPFYKKVGFVQDSKYRGSGQLRLTPAKAKKFQQEYIKGRNLPVRENPTPIDEMDFTALSPEAMKSVPSHPVDGIRYGEPYANKIFLGETKYFVNPVDLRPFLNKPLVLLGNKAYGIITLRTQDHIPLEDFWKSGISPTLRDTWWPDAKYFFLYLFDFEPFPKPETYRPTDQAGPVVTGVEFGDVPVESKKGTFQVALDTDFEKFRENPAKLGPNDEDTGTIFDFIQVDEAEMLEAPRTNPLTRFIVKGVKGSSISTEELRDGTNSVGTLSYSIKGDTIRWHLLYIEEPLRGQGHGTHAVERMIDKADSLGMKLSMAIKPIEQRYIKRHIRFYERYGFKVISRYGVHAVEMLRESQPRKNPVILSVSHAYPDFEGHHTDHGAEPLAYAIFKELSARGFKPETVKPTQANPSSKSVICDICKSHLGVASTPEDAIELFEEHVRESKKCGRGVKCDIGVRHNPEKDVKLLVGDEPRREVDLNRPTGYSTPFQKTLRRTVKVKDLLIDCHSFPADAAHHDTDGWNDSDVVLLETIGVTDKTLMKALHSALTGAGFKAKMDTSKRVNQIQITGRLLRARPILIELNEKHLKSGKLDAIAKVIAHTLADQHDLNVAPTSKSVMIQDPKSEKWKTVPEYLKGHGFAVPNPGPPVLEHHPAQSDTPLANAIAGWKTFQQLPVDKVFKMTIPDIPSSMVYMGRVHALTYHCSKWSRTEGVSSDLTRTDNIVADNVNINYRHQWKQNNPHLFKHPTEEQFYIYGELKVLGVGVDDSDRPNPRPMGSKINITVPSHVGLIGDLKSIELVPEGGGEPLTKVFSGVLLAMDGEGAYRHLYILKGRR